MTNIHELINEVRTEMIKLANEYGYTSKQALECSQKLDKLLNLLMLPEQSKKESTMSKPAQLEHW